MTTYQQIPASVDFSEHTDAVIQSALKQAECSGARLAVLHVVDYTRPIDDDYIIPPDDAVETALLASAKERLEDHPAPPRRCARPDAGRLWPTQTGNPARGGTGGG